MKSKRGEEFIFNSAEQEVKDTHGNVIILKGYLNKILKRTEETIGEIHGST